MKHRLEERILEVEEAIVLGAASGYAAPRLGRAARQCRSLDDLLGRSDADLCRLPGIGEKTLPHVRRIADIDLEREQARLDRLGLTVLVPGRPGWPPLMSENISVPPLALYVRGDPAPLGEAAVAVVGTRKASPIGLRVAEGLGFDLGRIPLTVVSGLAVGIDAAAHRGCLAGSGRTVAVLAHGLDRVHPGQNRKLADGILDGGGALVSEYHPGVKPLAETFVPRNRIIAGLSLATVVVEGKEGSGARHTARFAGDFDREVLAVPGSPLDDRSNLPNELIRTGATLCRGAYDVISVIGDWEIGSLREALADRAAFLRRQAADALRGLGPEADRIVRILADEPLHIDGICRFTGIAAERVLNLLLQLEIEGIVEQLPGMRYMPIYNPPDPEPEEETLRRIT